MGKHASKGCLQEQLSRVLCGRSKARVALPKRPDSLLAILPSSQALRRAGIDRDFRW